ncbi:uncharacterized protein N0V89_012207 [Didymosphaeria variabile]|uniref:Uncharacterized protein n=1 Tax=Didymosphaeria variabile TaxID=1932322 RepID=A0A9W8X9E0_9PLEO|nr:uncharacterized protein N0V89_012207 [Didymosphaeria variabile]KAJ4344465.1 hypothetical protein N0V89_012207 [Didymosphaeria variabile]
MPPFGLYPVPRHHIYGGRIKPKVYNTKDFQDQDQNQDQDAPAASGRALPANVDGTVGSRSVTDATKNMKKAAKKEKKRLPMDGDKNAELERLLKRAEAMSDKDGRSKKKDKKKHRQSDTGTHGTADASEVVSAPPRRTQQIHKNGADQGGRSEKKRKRESEAHAAAANARLVNEEYLAGQQLDSLFRFGSSPPKHPRQVAQGKEQPSKKKTKRKSQNTQQNATEHTQSAQVTGSDQPRVQKAKRKTHIAFPGSPQAADEHNLVPRDWIDGSDELKVKENKEKQINGGLASDPTTPSLIPIRIPRQTPIPLPQLFQEPTTKPTGTKTHKNNEEDLPHSKVLVPETPPSKTPKRTPVPLSPNLKLRNDTVATEYKPSKTYRRTVLGSSPTPNSDFPVPSTAPAAVEPSQVVSELPSVPNALTDANLRSFKKPLIDGTKPRPRTRTGASTITSVRTSSASMSILEAFARVGKPYVRSAAEKDPFVTTNDRLETLHEDREEVPLDVFTARYREVTNFVNFDQEDQYLEEHLEWDAKHNGDPAPCLHKMTGCSAKKEELLRLSKEENMEVLGQLDYSGDDKAKLQEASNHAQRAEDLLMLATRAHIPVPIGCVEGRWTLYCPKYAETHFDRYGYGQRSLTISSIAGFKHKNNFTARMQLPPRTMAFSILAFQTPPHASFRTTTIKTASEGYTMDIIFLGNGFLHLRADLGRLLTGTIRKPHEHSHAMEFIGVHDRATQWWAEKKEEVEEEGGKPFAKYDGQAVRE